jgi:ferritin
MLKPKIQDAINDQINAELYSSYLYLSMAAYFRSLSLDGMSHWMQIQAQEELIHVMKFFNFINDRDGRVKLGPVEGPKTEWDSPADAFKDAYAHECMISGRINDLTSLANSEGDHTVATFLQWFVTEQIEEEANAKAIVDKLKMVGDNGVALFMMDAELGQRPAPAASAGSLPA